MQQATDTKTQYTFIATAKVSFFLPIETVSSLVPFFFLLLSRNKCFYYLVARKILYEEKNLPDSVV